MRFYASAAAAVFLSGCAGWSKPGATESDFRRDSYQCEMEAARAYPVMIVTSGGYRTPDNTNCRVVYGQVQCQTTPGATLYQTQSDANLNARTAAHGQCLRARGYIMSFR